jgi:hypothetical protein
MRDWLGPEWEARVRALMGLRVWEMGSSLTSLGLWTERPDGWCERRYGSPTLTYLRSILQRLDYLLIIVRPQHPPSPPLFTQHLPLAADPCLELGSEDGI